LTSRYNYRHLAFTGSKDRITVPQKVRLQGELERLRDQGFLWMHNGDCVVSDATAAQLWRKLGRKIMLHPPLIEKYRAFEAADIICEPRDYLVRDRHMVECSEFLLATPQTFDEQRRSGTWTTIRYARKLRMQILIIQPDGTLNREDY